MSRQFQTSAAPCEGLWVPVTERRQKVRRDKVSPVAGIPTEKHVLRGVLRRILQAHGPRRRSRIGGAEGFGITLERPLVLLLGGVEEPFGMIAGYGSGRIVSAKDEPQGFFIGVLARLVTIKGGQQLCVALGNFFDGCGSLFEGLQNQWIVLVGFLFQEFQ